MNMNARLSCRRRHFHVETGVVDENDQREVAALHHSSQAAQQRKMTRDVLDDFEKPHHSELAVSVNQLDALLCQPRAAYGSKTELGSQALECCRDASCVEIAGCLAGYE